VDLQLTEVESFAQRERKLHDDISVGRQAAGTLQVKHNWVIQVLYGQLMQVPQVHCTMPVSWTWPGYWPQTM